MRVLDSGGYIFLPQVIGGSSVFAIGTVLAVCAVLSLQVEEEMRDVHRPGVVYLFVLYGLDPKFIGGESVLAGFSLRADRHSHLKRIAGEKQCQAKKRGDFEIFFHKNLIYCLLICSHIESDITLSRTTFLSPLRSSSEAEAGTSATLLPNPL